MFKNTEPVPPVYCCHGSNHLSNKQPLFAVDRGLPRNSLRSQKESQRPAATAALLLCCSAAAACRMETLGWHGVVTVVSSRDGLVCGVVAAAARMSVVRSDRLSSLAACLIPTPPPQESFHLSDGRGAVLRRALFADNTWKGVGPVWKQSLGFCPVLCLLWRGCFQATASRRSLLSPIRAAIMDYLVHFVSSAFSQASGAQILGNGRQTLREALCCRTFGPL